MGLKVILTGVTGMVGEGVSFECLQNPDVAEVLVIGRRHYDGQHAKLKELIVPDFFQLDKYAEQVKGYDACFFCAGISSVGMKEEKYTHITYDTTMAFAKSLLAVNPGMTFIYISGAHTDSSEKSKIMWARVKGRTENDLLKLGFKAAYNFRPGVMLTFPEQKNGKMIYTVIASIIRFFSAKNVITMHELGKAMINAARAGYSKQVLEISDIKTLAKGTQQ
ncbi:NAD-dependent epimerase/dehydratase family protein [Chitinophaga barathri]|uniref:NAD-dependent epimerase/dehydratase family protein n=1 Tax=Chitinophaga barathri TaxID=1647451 RepID=A0A3N4MRU4_9BACT|nr:NAD-dependent epimerase/dehydratase family protein [Chitinophaga barathri]RPD42289.1 NAD-dependent epimerase/dehydratase family protein [Chitinophaga barathri]